MLPVIRRGISILRGDKQNIDASGRRTFLALGAAAAGSALLGRGAEAETAEAFPPKDAPWSQSLGPGIVDRPVWAAVGFRQGHDPPQRSLAHRQQGILGQLLAVAGSERHHHAERAVLRALPRRPRRSRSEAAPPHDPRPGGTSARSHHGRTSNAFRPCRASISSNVRPMAAWSGARRSSIRCNSPTAW